MLILLIFLWSWFLGQLPGPPTPPSTPKTDLHVGPKDEVQRPADAASRQNIDFSHVDISDLSTDVIGTIDGFDVREFDQYLSPNNHGPTALPPSDTGHGYPNSSGLFISPGIHPHSIPTTSTGTFSHDQPIRSEDDDAAARKPQVKTEQMSPDHRSGSCPSPPSPRQPEGHPVSTPPASSTHPPDYSDLQSSSFYGTISGYAAPLYQHPYFHMPYATPLINSLALAPPAHSPPPGWEQPIYTTLTRP